MRRVPLTALTAAVLVVFAAIAPPAIRPEAALAGPAADQIAFLEARVSALEVRVTALEGGPSPSVSSAPPTATPTPTPPPPTPSATPRPTPSPSPVTAPGPCPSSLQTAINAAANGTTLDLTGCSFTVGTTVSVANRSDLTIVGGSVKGTGYFPVFRLSCDTRVTLRSWTITGADPTPGTYKAGQEDAHGVDVKGGTAIGLDRLTISNVQGDGIYFAQCGTTNGNGATVTALHVHDFARMGIAIVAFNGVTATDSVMSNAGYRFLDVEPDCNGSYQQQAIGIDFERGTFTGWLRRDPGAAPSGTSWVYIGTPSCAGGNVPRVENITVRGFDVDVSNDVSPHFATAVQPAGYRVKGVTIDGNTDRDLIWSNNCSNADGYALTNNHFIGGVRGGFLVATGCTGVVQSGNATS